MSNGLVVGTKNNRKEKIAAILINVLYMSCIVVCSLFAGYMTFSIEASLFMRTIGTISIIRSLTGFVEMGIFAKRIVNNDNKMRKESILKNLLYITMGASFLTAGIFIVSCNVGKIGIIAVIFGGADMIGSCCDLVLPIVSKGQIEDSVQDIEEEILLDMGNGLNNQDAIDISKEVSGIILEEEISKIDFGDEIEFIM